jgi:hypothetical protein
MKPSRRSSRDLQCRCVPLCSSPAAAFWLGCHCWQRSGASCCLGPARSLLDMNSSRPKLSTQEDWSIKHFPLRTIQGAITTGNSGKCRRDFQPRVSSTTSARAVSCDLKTPWRPCTAMGFVARAWLLRLSR